MEKKIQQEVIDVTGNMSYEVVENSKLPSTSPKKIAQFVEKLKAMPDVRGDLPEKSVSKREKFFQKILEEIGPQ